MQQATPGRMPETGESIGTAPAGRPSVSIPPALVAGLILLWVVLVASSDPRPPGRP